MMDKETTVIKQVQIPLTGTTWAILQVPVPMSEENWRELLDFLKLMKKPITGSASNTQAADVHDSCSTSNSKEDSSKL